MTDTSESRQRALLAALRRRFTLGAERDDAVGEEIRRVEARLDRLSAPPGALVASGHPLTRHLPDVLARVAVEAPDIAAALAPIAADLPWRYGYAPRDDAPGLDGTMGWAELVGPLAPFVSDEVCFGLTLIGPRAHYLAHRHPAIELYRIVVGHPRWRVEDDVRLRAPGDVVLHRENVVHAMETDEEAMLAIYSWTGDVVSPSVWA